MHNTEDILQVVAIIATLTLILNFVDFYFLKDKKEK